MSPSQFYILLPKVTKEGYAQAKIADYWVVDLKNRQLHVFRDPTPTGYTSHLILREPHQVSPLGFPELTVTLASILPPVS